MSRDNVPGLTNSGRHSSWRAELRREAREDARITIQETMMSEHGDATRHGAPEALDLVRRVRLMCTNKARTRADRFAEGGLIEGYFKLCTSERSSLQLGVCDRLRSLYRELFNDACVKEANAEDRRIRRLMLTTAAKYIKDVAARTELREWREFRGAR